MLLTKTVIQKWNSKIKKHYESKGYIYTKIGDEFEINVEHLTNGSHVDVEVKCDCKDCKDPYLPFMKWKTYLRYAKEDGKYYCKSCAIKLFGTKNMINSKLKNSKSFEQWCIKNNRQDVLDRWDYELNNCRPDEISYSTNKKYYFNCPKGIHESELKKINSFVNGQEGSMYCNKCNSFAQWGIDNLGEDFLEKYWSDKNTVSPWGINRGINSIKVYIKCEKDISHRDYYTTCCSFTSMNTKCPVCNKSKGEKKIEEYLINRNINYNPQHKCDELIGLGGGNLSYDFYLPKHNTLIEYDGEFHYKPIKLYKNEPTKSINERYEKQKYHDKLKNEYAENNKIKLLRIPYWDFDNIEEILDKELNKYNTYNKKQFIHIETIKQFVNT